MKLTSNPMYRISYCGTQYEALNNGSILAVINANANYIIITAKGYLAENCSGDS